jgi:Tfp pilus assembly protein PilO
MSNMSDRDRKILLIVVPVAVLVAFWFLLLSPKRQEASKASDGLAKQEQRLDEAKAAAASAEASKNTFASDYTSLVKLGKAVPSRLDMPSVIVQLESAARGTGISFTKIATGEREAAPATATAQPPAAPGKGNGTQPAAAGGAQAQSAPGKQAENAGNGVNTANKTTAATEQAGVSKADTQTSTPAGQAAAPAGASSTAPAGLDSVPIDLEFQGSFYKLADFFHSLKRFVRVADQRISVRGRLLTVESLSFSSDPQLFPRLKAELKATVYLAPVTQGATAGATPQGPAATAGTPSTTPTSGGSTPAPTPATPTATATP